MRFELLDNAIDTFRFGLDFYWKYLRLEDKYNEDNPGYLKMAVICIQNSLELFIKKILSNYNELLIYDDLSNKKLLEIFMINKNEYKNMPLDYFIINQTKIHTIDYTNLISRFRIICELNEFQYNTLENIGQLRNKITHFGIDKVMDFHEVIVTINNSLDLISELIYDELKTGKDEIHILDPIYEVILDILEIGRVEEEETWAVYYSEKFATINDMFGSLEEDIEFIELLNINGYKMKVELGEYIDSYKLECKFTHKDEDKNEVLQTINNPSLDSTVFAGEGYNGPIYFVIDHSCNLSKKNIKNDFFVYKKPYLKEDFDTINSKFWTDDFNRKTCYCTEFSYAQLKRAIKAILEIE